MAEASLGPLTFGSVCPIQLQKATPEEVRSQLKFRKVLERHQTYVRVQAQIAGTERLVAVHLIENEKLEASPGLRQQVQHTIQCYASLDHDHILQFYVAFEDPTFVYVVTELEVGPEVVGLLRSCASIPDQEVHGIAVAAVSALVYLHRKGLIHGAICPNIIVNCGLCWKLKFPIVNDAGSHKHLLPYLAPEQVVPEWRGHLTPKVDTWNLAAVLFHCLVGYAPFGPVHVGEDPRDGILRDEPFIPQTIPPVLRWIVQQGLTKNIHLRCTALDAWIALLQAQADEVGSDSEMENCSLPMWVSRRHDDDEESILIWPEESPKWTVPTVPDIEGASDQHPSDDMHHRPLMFRGQSASCVSSICSELLLGVVDDVAVKPTDSIASAAPEFGSHSAKQAAAARSSSSCEYPDFPRTDHIDQMDTISSCPASSSCVVDGLPGSSATTPMHLKQPLAPFVTVGLQEITPASVSQPDLAIHKRQRRLSMYAQDAYREDEEAIARAVASICLDTAAPPSDQDSGSNHLRKISNMFHWKMQASLRKDSPARSRKWVCGSFRTASFSTERQA